MLANNADAGDAGDSVGHVAKSALARYETVQRSLGLAAASMKFSNCR